MAEILTPTHLMSLTLQCLAFLESGPTISLSVPAGSTLCVVGPAGSGKSELLRLLAGLDEPDRGTVKRPDHISIPRPCDRKVRPQDLSHKRGSQQAVRATHVLSQLGLWDVRQRPISDLPEAQVAACELVETFMSNSGLLVFDGELDRLDPWIRTEALNLIRDRCRDGAICAIATNQLDLASQFDYLIVLKEHQPVYAGSVADLIASMGQRSLTIESLRNPGVRALIEPLTVGVTQSEKTYKLEPGPGQELTAKLLREGYGDVKFLVTDGRSLAEIILTLIS